MSKRTVDLLPETEKILASMGKQIKNARRKRRLSAEEVASMAGISRATMVAIEKGSSSVAIGFYAAALRAMDSMDKDLLYIAKDKDEGVDELTVY